MIQKFGDYIYVFVYSFRMWSDCFASKISLILLSFCMALSTWAGQAIAAPPPAPTAPHTSSPVATSVLLAKGYEAYELLLKTDSGLPELHKINSVRLGRVIVAMAEFADNSEQVQLFLKKIESDKTCLKIKLPDWLVFVDEYKEALKRITRTAPKDVQTGTGELAFYESDSDLEWGLGECYTLSLLAHLAIDRLANQG